VCDELGFAYHARGKIHPSAVHFPQTWVFKSDLSFLWRQIAYHRHEQMFVNVDNPDAPDHQNV
jgi:hypothetical protein